LKAERSDFLELSQELLGRGAMLRFRAHGRSMHPFIKDGSTLIVEPVNGTSVNIGDIIFYRRPEGSLTAHRLIDISSQADGTFLITRGDSHRYHDPPVPAEQIMGRVIRVEGEQRQLQLNTWPGRPLGFLIACFARGGYPQRVRLVRNLGRLWWLLRGRRIKTAGSAGEKRKE
jgi:signal peptidase I